MTADRVSISAPFAVRMYLSTTALMATPYASDSHSIIRSRAGSSANPTNAMR
jgi:hypothetical protein